MHVHAEASTVLSAWFAERIVVFAPRAPWRLVVLTALLVGFLALPSAANGAGELDPTFGGDGRVLTDFGDFGFVEGVAIQADGRIVVAGESDAGPNPRNFALTRYNPDGSLDPSFGGDGRVVTDFGADDAADGVAIQADGRIVAAGASGAGPFGENNFALARYNPDGGLDPSFDGDGRVVTDFGGGDEALGVAIQADGRIVAAGGAGASGDGPNPDFALARYNPDGSLDPSFDGDGRVVTNFGSGFEDARGGVAIQADGRLVAAGVTGLGPNSSQFALARYNPDGSLDPSFDGDGRVVTDFGRSDEAGGVAIQADGRIVAAGVSGLGYPPPDFALARYNPDGSLDPSFDGDGKVLTDFGGGTFAGSFAEGVAIQADGRIVAAGASGASRLNFALARYDPDGGLDPSFSGGGRVLTDFGASEQALGGVAIQADGRIVAAGLSNAGANRFSVALARYLPGVPLNQPPDCSTVTASANTLRPPNHRLRRVSLGGATDPDRETVKLTITAVTQDEPLNGRGDGNTSPDAAAGSESNVVFLRAERSSRHDGRVYRVSFTGSDGKGGSCSGTITVGVPHDRGAGSTTIDSAPPSFNSFGP